MHSISYLSTRHTLIHVWWCNPKWFFEVSIRFYLPWALEAGNEIMHVGGTKVNCSEKSKLLKMWSIFYVNTLSKILLLLTLQKLTKIYFADKIKKNVFCFAFLLIKRHIRGVLFLLVCGNRHKEYILILMHSYLQELFIFYWIISLPSCTMSTTHGWNYSVTMMDFIT